MNMQKQTTEQKSVNESQEVIKQKNQSPASVSASAATLSSSAPISMSKKNLYERVSLWIITFATLLLPIFFLPVFNINFFYAKFGLATVAVLVAAITLTLQPRTLVS